MGSTPVGVQCPLTSLLSEFLLGYWAGSGILSYCPCRCPSPFPSPSISQCFSITHLCLPLDFICVSSLLSDVSYLRPSVDPSLSHLLGEFPGLGLALVPDVVVPEAEQTCTWSRNLNPNFCPGRARTSDLGI